MTHALARITNIVTSGINSRVTLEWDDPSITINEFQLSVLGRVLDWDQGKKTVVVVSPCSLEVGETIASPAPAQITAIATIKNATSVTLVWDDPSIAITDFDLFALGAVIDWDEMTVLLAGPCDLEAGSKIPYKTTHPSAGETFQKVLGTQGIHEDGDES